MLTRNPYSRIAVVVTGLGAIPLASPTAFLNLTGSFIILTTVSYALPFLANVLTGRKYFPKGPFHLGRYGAWINMLAVGFIGMFDTLYCFRELRSSILPLNSEIIRHWRLTSVTV